MSASLVPSCTHVDLERVVGPGVLTAFFTFFALVMANEELMRHYQAAVDAHRGHDLPTALASYRKVIELNPGIAAVHNNVAAILHSQGLSDEAIAAWYKAIALKPDYAEAHFNVAVLLSERGEEHLEKAKKHCTLAIKHKENYAAVRTRDRTQGITALAPSAATL